MVTGETIEVQAICRILQGLGGKLFIEENAITAEHFPKFPNEFTFIYNHCVTTGAVPSLLTFQTAFPAFPLIQYNATISEPDSYLVKALIDNKNSQIMLESLNKARVFMEADDYQSVMLLMSQTNEKISLSSGISAKNILTDHSRLASYKERLKNKTQFFCPTGFQEIDDVTGGWDRINEYAVIAARPGVGKSWVLLKSAEAALAAGLRVGVFSGEMDSETVAYRFDAISSHISNWNMAHGGQKIEADYETYLRALPNKYKTASGAESGLYILTPQEAGEAVGVSKLKAFIKKYNLNILLVDQQSLLIDDKKGKSSWEQASNKSIDLKALQITENIPIITVSQLNRDKNLDEKGKNQADTAQIAMSDRISQDASTIITISKEKQGDENILCLELLKTRASGGTNSKFKYVVDLDKGIFSYLPDVTTNVVDDQEKVKALLSEYGEDPSGLELFFSND